MIEDSIQVLAYAAMVRTESKTAAACLDAIMKIVGYPDASKMKRTQEISPVEIEKICCDSKHLPESGKICGIKCRSFGHMWQPWKMGYLP